jgi:DNA repair protein RadC
MTYSLRISDMSESERPRERLLNHGVKHLASAELLAILLGTGQGAGKLSAVGLGQLILQTIGAGYDDPVASLQTVTAQELMAIPGVGPAKATTILAAIELGNRTFFAKPPERAEISDPSVAAAALSQDLMWQSQEKLAVLMLDSRNRIITKQILTIGTATETLAHPRDIFRAALKCGAVKLIVAHNHPSGDTEPSEEDRQLTVQLLEAGAILGMPLLDHLILGNGSFTSMHQTTSIWDNFAAKYV